MASLNNDKTDFIQYAKKYSRVVLRYLIAFIIWTVREFLIALSYLRQGLGVMWKYIVRYSIFAWRWIKWTSPIAWDWTKYASAVAWRWICKSSVYCWCWIKVMSSRLVRLMLVSFWHFDRWTKVKYEQYLEFKRTKGFKGLAKDVRAGVKTSFNHYMEEDQVPSTEHVMSDDELLEEELGNENTIRIGKRIDKFVKNIVNEK